MSDDTRRYDRALTPDEMEGVLDAISGALTPSGAVEAGVFAVFRALNPGFDAEFAQETPIKPTDYRIPSRQWVKIAEALQGKCSTQIDKVQINLTFMNFGPSSKDA